MAYATINKPNQYFDTTTYTANGGSQTITNSGSMQPDFFWGKVRSTTSNHILINSIAGVSKYLYSNTTGSEVTDANYLTSFNANGFSLGSNNYSNGTTMVAWQWKANGVGVSNTQGSITSTVSANQTAGFSIVSYTGDGVNNRTVGHGLGATPKFVIIKNRSAGTAFWSVINPRSTSTTDTNMLYLNSTAAEADDTNIMGTNLPNSTTFGIGNYAGVNVNAQNFIAYCWSEIKGYSKFGSYVGNGSNTDNTFVYTGFKPALLIVKDTGINSWNIMDNKMNPTNTTYTNFLFPDLSNAQSSGTYNFASFYSNGFKIGDSNSNYGGSGRTYIYMAFAENPLVGTNNIPTTAR